MRDTLPGLTACQDVLVDLLVARSRLGESFWPISTRLNRTYKILEEKGYVEIMHGHVDGTVRLALTPQAKAKLIENSAYVPPIKLEARDEIATVIEKLGGDPTTVRMIRTSAYGGIRR